jgi:hypothetical protein
VSDNLFEQTKLHHELQIKERDLAQKELDLFNRHQEDTRKRIDTIAKSALLISGGALTVSVGIFLRADRPKLLPGLLSILQFSWYALFYCLIAFVFVMGFMVLAAYVLGERWRRKLNNESVDASGWPPSLSLMAWFFGITGLMAFLIGLGCLAYVAVSLAAR